MSFSAKFNLVAEWFDYRLTWNNLNNDKFLNIPDREVFEKLWVPVVIFENTENKHETPMDKKARLVVERRGNYTLAPITETEEIAYYKGSESSLQYSRDFYLRLKCQFELQNYPFDKQICKILLKKPSKEDKFLQYIPKKIGYTGPLDMAEFVITDYDMIDKAEDSEADIEVRIFMKRRIQKHLLSTYLPSLCILIIAQVAIYFYKEHFKTAIPLAITSMLVMYTLKGSISAQLPTTSYIKFIDIWLLYGILMPFFILIVIVLMEHLPPQQQVDQ